MIIESYCNYKNGNVKLFLWLQKLYADIEADDFAHTIPQDR